VIVSSQGIPDVSTRLFLKKLSRKTQATIVLLTDWDPAGIQMYLTYRLGSVKMLHQNSELTTDMKWLGLRSKHVERYVVYRTPA
jgi:meiotic recombination protein SPO11